MENPEKVLIPEIIFTDGFSGLPAETVFDSFLREISRMVPLPGSGNCQVEILLTDDVEIRRLNRKFRGKDQVTDVLSFPDGENLPGSGDVFLGSIAISVERAGVQAEEIGHSLEEELNFLILHGLLHLLGYDHEVDQGEMLRLQQELKAALPAFFGEKN
ncbi:MAG: rRNA maturation RNase YbeY [Acidobacteria bacterium]|nr:rRNA maturation RNase YbeY [Acidobacteriota bacterium]